MRDEEGVSRARPSREDSLARHHLRLEDHHRVALNEQLDWRLDDLDLPPTLCLALTNTMY